MTSASGAHQAGQSRRNSKEDNSDEEDNDNNTSNNDDDQAVGFFADSLSSLFDVHTPSRGTPGSTLTYEHPLLPALGASSTAITFHLPNHDGSNTQLFAHYQWDAGWELANEMVLSCQDGNSQKMQAEVPVDRWADVRNMSCVELGAGTGLPSLVAARVGARQVVVTDYPDPGILRTLEKNVALQKRSGDCSGGGMSPEISVAGLEWGNETQGLHVSSYCPDGFDRLIICDTLWIGPSHPLLLFSILTLIHRQRGRVLMAAGFHSGVPCVQRFFQVCERGLSGLGRLVPDVDFGAGERSTGVWVRNVQTGQERRFRYRLEDEAKQEEQDERMAALEERSKWCVMARLKWAAAEPESQQDQSLRHA